MSDSAQVMEVDTSSDSHAPEGESRTQKFLRLRRLNVAAEAALKLAAEAAEAGLPAGPSDRKAVQSDAKTQESPPEVGRLPSPSNAKTTPYIPKRPKLADARDNGGADDGRAARDDGSDGGGADGDDATQQYLPPKPVTDPTAPVASAVGQTPVLKQDADHSDAQDQETQDQEAQEAQARSLSPYAESQQSRQSPQRSLRAGPAGGAAGGSGNVRGLNNSLWSVLPDENPGDYNESVTAFKALLKQVGVSSLSAEALKRIRSVEETIQTDEKADRHGGTAYWGRMCTQADETIRKAQTEELAPHYEDCQRLERAMRELQESLAHRKFCIKQIQDRYVDQQDQNTTDHANLIRTRQKKLLPDVVAAVRELQAIKDSRVPGSLDSCWFD